VGGWWSSGGGERAIRIEPEEDRNPITPYPRMPRDLSTSRSILICCEAHYYEATEPEDHDMAARTTATSRNSPRPPEGNRDKRSGCAVGCVQPSDMAGKRSRDALRRFVELGRKYECDALMGPPLKMFRDGPRSTPDGGPRSRPPLWARRSYGSCALATARGQGCSFSLWGGSKGTGSGAQRRCCPPVPPIRLGMGDSDCVCVKTHGRCSRFAVRFVGVRASVADHRSSFWLWR